MEHEWDGPCGLRRRLELAYEDIGDVRDMAELLDVNPANLDRALEDKNYEMPPDEQANAWANLYLVANINEHTKKIGAGQDRQITAWLSALWTAEAIVNIPLSNYVREFAWVF